MSGPVRLMRTGAPEEDRRAGQLVADVNEALSRGILGARRLTVEVQASADVHIAHGLGRVPTAWLVVDVTVPDSMASAPLLHRVSWDAQTLTLHNSAASASKISLLVW